MLPPSTELPPAAWSAEADVGAERRNQVPYRDPSRCRAGRRPAPGTTGHSEPEAGSLKPNGEAAAAWILVATRRPGKPPVVMKPPSRGAWRCKRGRGTFSGRADEAQRWQARRAETVLAATAGRPARRSRRIGRQRKASQGTLAALLRLRPSRAARDGSPISTHQPRPPRGRMTRSRGAVDCIAPARCVSMPCRFGSRAGADCSRPGQIRYDEPRGRTRVRSSPSGRPDGPCPGSGGANPVAAQSVRRRVRPSRSSAPCAGRTGRCAGTRPRPGCR